MIVVTRTDEDVSWLPVHFGDIPSAVYQQISNMTLHRLRCPPGAFDSIQGFS